MPTNLGGGSLEVHSVITKVISAGAKSVKSILHSGDLHRQPDRIAATGGTLEARRAGTSTAA